MVRRTPETGHLHATRAGRRVSLMVRISTFTYDEGFNSDKSRLEWAFRGRKDTVDVIFLDWGGLMQIIEHRDRAGDYFLRVEVGHVGRKCVSGGDKKLF